MRVKRWRPLRRSWHEMVAAALVIAIGALTAAPSAMGFIFWVATYRHGNSGSLSLGLFRANQNGTGQRRLRSNTNIPYVAMAASGNYLYAQSNAGIARWRVDGSHYDGSFIRTSNPLANFYLTVSGGRIYWDAVNENSGQSEIARANVNGSHANLGFIKLTPPAQVTGIAVEGAYIYWLESTPSDTGSGTIGRARLNGSGANENFIALPSDARPDVNIAADGRYLYVANSNPTTVIAEILRTRIDGSGKPQLNFLNLGFSENMDRDLLSGLAAVGPYIYWSHSGPKGGVYRANLNGSAVKRLIPVHLCSGCAVEELAVS